ncbi:glycosyl transferase [Exophiala viscosa]|uniref:glycosyl transferase n=1 Tax=Exophiala viscosa TaxID=2486360 RepID=UPI0021A1A097|nr:glycosyl transferase [Exophiala viscosa]
MPLVRKNDQRRPAQLPMRENAMSASTSSTTLYEAADPYLEKPPSAYPPYQNYTEDVPIQTLSPRGRPSPPDYHNRTLSELMTDTYHDDRLEPPTPNGHSAFSPQRAPSWNSEANTRSNSPYPSSPAQYAAGTPWRSQETLRPLVPDAPTQNLQRDWVKSGSIAQIQSRDDKDFLYGWKKWLFRFVAPILAIVALALYWLYFGMRITFVIDAQRKYHAPFPLAWIFIAIEISVAIPIFMQTFWSLFIMKKRQRPKLRLLGTDVPTVDIFITCCGEDDDVILDTVRAACDVDYPADRFRVLLLDDGKSDSLKQAIEDMRETFANTYYIRRPKFPGVPHHFKAGNLNYGMEAVHNLPGGASEYMAALDADMIPEQHWLRAVLPHLLLDEKMALACPPQLFYNVPRGDPLCQSLDFFVHVSEPVKDALGVAWCTGSGYVIRRTAIDQIGGFPRGSLAEDVATSTLMLGKGWKTAYVHEPLQYGTVPEDFGSHLKQRTRWAIGTVDTSFKLKFCLFGDAVKQMTFAQRMSSFIYAFLSLFNIFLMLSLFAMPIVLIANKPLVAYANEEQLRWLIRTCFAVTIMNRLCELVLYIPAGYATGQRGARAQLWMAPYIALTIIRSFVLPTWLGGQTQAFKPTGSLQSALNERNAKLRAPMYRRLWTILVNYLALFHVSYVYFMIVAVTISTYRCFLQHGLRAKLMCLLTHAWWVPLAWIIIVSAFWIPFTYAVDPPNCPDREDLLDRDPKTGVAHPTKESKKIAFRGQTLWFEIEYTFTTLFTTAVFVASFFY